MGELARGRSAGVIHQTMKLFGGGISTQLPALWMLSWLMGCGGYVPLSAPTAGNPDRSASIRLGEMERAEVRALLGQPVVSSGNWGFDLFRSENAQRAVAVATLIPVGLVKDMLNRYTLVTYDPAGRAEALASGLFRRPTRLRQGDPISSDARSLHLRVGELLFFAHAVGSRRENLLATPKARDAFLKRAGFSTESTIVIGAGDRAAADEVSIDGAPRRPVPMRSEQYDIFFSEGEREAWLQGIEAPVSHWHLSEPWAQGAKELDAVVVLRLPAGEHTLQFSGRRYRGNHTVSVSCRPGQVAYLVVDPEEGRGGLRRPLVDWRTQLTETMPDRFSQRPLVLMMDGEWYVDADPVK